MFDHVISNNAKEDLKRIYAFGLMEFGENQTDKYFYDFFKTFDEITANPFLYQSIDHIRPGYRRCTCGSDSIFYRVNGSTVEIMAILGG